MKHLTILTTVFGLAVLGTSDNLTAQTHLKKVLNSTNSKRKSNFSVENKNRLHQSSNKQVHKPLRKPGNTLLPYQLGESFFPSQGSMSTSNSSSLGKVREAASKPRPNFFVLREMQAQKAAAELRRRQIQSRAAQRNSTAGQSRPLNIGKVREAANTIRHTNRRSFGNVGTQNNLKPENIRKYRNSYGSFRLPSQSGKVSSNQVSSSQASRLARTSTSTTGYKGSSAAGRIIRGLPRRIQPSTRPTRNSRSQNSSSASSQSTAQVRERDLESNRNEGRPHGTVVGYRINPKVNEYISNRLSTPFERSSNSNLSQVGVNPTVNVPGVPSPEGREVPKPGRRNGHSGGNSSNPAGLTTDRSLSGLGNRDQFGSRRSAIPFSIHQRPETNSDNSETESVDPFSRHSKPTGPLGVDSRRGNNVAQEDAEYDSEGNLSYTTNYVVDDNTKVYGELTFFEAMTGAFDGKVDEYGDSGTVTIETQDRDNGEVWIYVILENDNGKEIHTFVPEQPITIELKEDAKGKQSNNGTPNPDGDYDPERAAQIREWVNKITGRNSKEDAFLFDGTAGGNFDRRIRNWKVDDGAIEPSDEGDSGQLTEKPEPQKGNQELHPSDPTGAPATP